MNKMQEKFQIMPSPKNDEPSDHTWANFKDNRVISRVPDTEESVDFSQYGGPSGMKMSHNNATPPGMYIDNQRGVSHKFGKITPAGATDESNSVNDSMLLNGFSKQPMSPTDDQYTDEHRDDFYDDVGGFVERANYLDRI